MKFLVIGLIAIGILGGAYQLIFGDFEPTEDETVRRASRLLAISLYTYILIWLWNNLP